MNEEKQRKTKHIEQPPARIVCQTNRRKKKRAYHGEEQKKKRLKWNKEMPASFVSLVDKLRKLYHICVCTFGRCGRRWPDMPVFVLVDVCRYGFAGALIS